MHELKESEPSTEHPSAENVTLPGALTAATAEPVALSHTNDLALVDPEYLTSPLPSTPDMSPMQDSRLHRLVHDIHEKHGRMILRLSSAQNLQPADQQNLVQDVYLKIVASIGGLRDEDKIESWVKTVFFSTRNNYMRKNKKCINNRELNTEETENYAHHRKIAITDNIEDVAISNLQHTEVLRSFYEVVRKWANTKHQKVVILHFIHQKTYREIASETGINESTCKIIIHRKRPELLEALQNFRQEVYEDAA